MHILPITTRTLTPPKDDVFDVLDEFIDDLRDGDILCITSKILAIHQGRCIPLEDAPDKDALIKSEADITLPRNLTPGEHAMHTMTDGNLAVGAGIDASNGNGHYILWPEDSSAAAREIHKHLTKKFEINDLGIIITDSHSVLLRYGAVGYAIGAYGIAPLQAYAGTNDLFNRKLVYEQANILDSLAAAAVLTMGEGGESKPLCIVRDVLQVTFDTQAEFTDLQIPLEDDIYYPFLKIFKQYAKSSATQTDNK